MVIFHHREDEDLSKFFSTKPRPNKSKKRSRDRDNDRLARAANDEVRRPHHDEYSVDL